MIKPALAWGDVKSLSLQLCEYSYLSRSKSWGPPDSGYVCSSAWWSRRGPWISKHWTMVRQTQAWFLQASGTGFLSISPYLTLFPASFCWKTPYRIYIVKSITSHPQPTAPCPTPGRSWPGPRFLSESRPKPSCSRSTNGSSPLCVGAILNNEISSGKRKNVKNMAVTTPWKGRLLAGWEQNRRQGTSFSASSGNLVFTDSTYLLLCPRPTTKALEVLIWGYK